MLASAAIATARKLLGDEAGETWTDADLLDYLNGGRRQIAVVRPDAVALKMDIALDAGVEQAIPANAFKLLNITSNVSPTRRTVVYVETDALNAINLDWRDADAGDYIEHYTYDEDDPLSFEVYPPALAGMVVRALVAIRPTDISLGTDIGFDAVYDGPLIDWIVYRASSTPRDASDDAQRAANALQTFMQALSGKAQVDAVVKPQRK